MNLFNFRYLREANAAIMHLQRENRRLSEERDIFKSERDALDRVLVTTRADLAAAKQVQPANLGHVTHFLKAFVPTLSLAPGYHMLIKATDEKAYALALNLLLENARLVGWTEASSK